MFKWIKRILLLLIILIATLSGFKLSFDNNQSVELILFGWPLLNTALPLGLWVSGALLLGCLLGLLLSYLPNAFNKRSLTTKDNKIKRLEEKLEKLSKSAKG